MEPDADSTRSFLSPDARVVLLGLVIAALTAAGVFFQKVNGVRIGNPWLSGWLVLAAICFFPTFVITNKVFLMGGKVSVLVPATAATYVFSMLTGRYYFGEEVSNTRWFGCALIIAGVAAIARG
jgi:drug/metabolite transporter (DMT)-like permease